MAAVLSDVLQRFFLHCVSWTEGKNLFVPVLAAVPRVATGRITTPPYCQSGVPGLIDRGPTLICFAH